MPWVTITTKRSLPNSKRHLPMRYLGPPNTIYLSFIEYQRRKPKTYFFKKILETNDWPPKIAKRLLVKLKLLLEVKQDK